MDTFPATLLVRKTFHTHTHTQLHHNYAIFFPRKVIHACIFFCYFRVSFKDPDNAKVVDRLIKEVQGANPEFQSGLIRGWSFLGLF